MIGEVLADLDAAVADLEVALVDERAERVLDDGAEGLVHRVHLEDADLVVDDELVEHVHGGDGALVAGAEDDADAALAGLAGGLLTVDAPLGGPLAGLDPDVAGHAGEERLVDEVLREDAGHPLAVGATVRGGELGLAVGLERLGEEAEVAHRGQRAAEVFLAVAVATDGITLDARRELCPAIGDLERGLHATPEEGGAGLRRERDPLFAVARDSFELALHFVEGRGRHRQGFCSGRHEFSVVVVDGED